jgi:hypothetical protein
MGNSPEQTFTDVTPIQQTFTDVAPIGGSSSAPSKTWWERIKDEVTSHALQEGQKSGTGVPGSFEGHPENIGQYVPSTVGPIVQGGKDIAQGNIARGAHEVLGGVSNAALPAAPFLLAAAPAAVTLRSLAGGAAGQYLASKGASALGANPDQAAIAGDIGGIAGGAASSKLASLSDFLKGSAQKNYEAILNPTKEATKYQTQKIMPQLLEERPVAISRQSLANKAAAEAETAGQQIEGAVSNLKGTMNTQPVIDALDNLKSKNMVNGVDLRPEVSHAVDQVSEQMKAMGPDISLQDAVKARRILDEAVQESKGYLGAQLSDASMAAIRKESANSIRAELGKASPDLAAVNAKFHFWNTLSDVMEATIQRKTGQANRTGAGLLGTIETAAAGQAGLAKGGLATGGTYAGAMYALGKLVRSTAWKSVSASSKMAIADALASEDYDGFGKLIGSLPVALKSAGDATH